MRILFLGAPGSGKGTQAVQVAEKLVLLHISTGDIFRRHMEESTPLGVRVKEIVEQGGLVPDDLTIQIVTERLTEPDAATGFILDGFPRTLGQAQALDEAAGSLDAVVILEVSEDELLRRMLQRGRADDTEESIRRRLEIYVEQTEPLIGYYRDRSRLVHVPGAGEVEEVTSRILVGLEQNRFRATG